MKKSSLTFLRLLAQIFVLIGISSSFFYVVDAARHSNSIAHFSYSNMLKLACIIWVLLPLMSLLMANLLSRAWSTITRRVLYILIMLVTLASLISYSGTFLTVGNRHITTFIIIPLITWLFIMTIMTITAKIAERKRN